LLQTAIDKVALQRLAQFANSTSFMAKVSELYVRISRTAIPFMLLAVALAPCGMVVLAGSRYAGATWPTILLLVAAFVQIIAIPVDRAVYVGVPGHIRLGFAAFEAALVLGAVALLVPVAGLVGVAAARIISPGFVFLFGLLILNRRFALVLPVDPVAIALVTALPGTLAALLLFPNPHGLASALSETAMVGAGWCILFLALSWLFDRQFVENAAALALHRWRATFPSSAIATERARQ
jgi:hypothetical protein